MRLSSISQGEDIKWDDVIVVIPRTLTPNEEEREEVETGDLDNMEDPLPLELNTMLKSLPRGGTKRKEVKRRNWKASVQAYNDL